MHYTVTPIRSVFTRRGYKVQLFNDDGSPVTRYLPVLNHDGSKVKGEFGRPVIHSTTDPATFFGNDGRTVRAEAVAWAKAQIQAQRKHG